MFCCQPLLMTSLPGLNNTKQHNQPFRDIMAELYSAIIQFSSILKTRIYSGFILYHPNPNKQAAYHPEESRKACYLLHHNKNG